MVVQNGMTAATVYHSNSMMVVVVVMLVYVSVCALEVGWRGPDQPKKGYRR